ncbi:hypothetical protein [Halobacillus andaensis]|uniref:hypothetical protein n=1 Tax=Halobacillus andaensis TaxID=1176239 RepID=UPI003D759659
MEKDLVIYNQTMAGYLMMHGCRLKKLAPNKNKPTMNVYYFPDTEHVREKVKEHLKQPKK